MSTRLSARTSKTRWRQRQTAAAALTALMAGAALAACSPAEPDSGNSAAEPSPAKISVEFPDNSALKASVENIDPSDEMQSAVTAAMRVNDVASLELDGDLPAGGAEVSFTREDRAVPADGISVIAHWNDAAREWEPLETTLSEDRKTLTATAGDLSVFAVIDAVGSAGERPEEPNRTDEPTRDEEPGNWLGARTEAPDCSGDIPEWVGENWEPQHEDNTVLSCWQADPEDPEILQVHVTNNRPYAGLVWSAAQPVNAESEDLLGLDLMQVSNDLAQTAVLQGSETVDGSAYPVTGLGTTTLSYTREALRQAYGSLDEPGESLIAVETNPAFALIGIALSGLNDDAAQPGQPGQPAQPGTGRQLASMILQANDCMANLGTAAEEGIMAFTGADFELLADCMAAADYSADPAAAHPMWFTADAAEVSAEASAEFSQGITGVLEILTAGKLTALAHQVLVDSFGAATVNTIDFRPSAASSEEFELSVWEEVITSDGALAFDIPQDWTVRELPTESNDHDDSTGVTLEVVNAEDRTMGMLSSGLIHGQAMFPQHPFYEFDYEELPRLENTEPDHREDPAFVYQALEMPGGFQAMLGLTNYGSRAGTTELSVMPQGFSFVEGAGGGFFSLFIKPEEMFPNSSLDGYSALESYRETAEYADIKRMMMSLRFAAPDTTPGSAPSPTEDTYGETAFPWPESEWQ